MALAVGMLFMMAQPGVCFTKTSGYWSICGGRAEAGRIVLLMEYSEKTFRRGIGDVLLAERGEKVAGRSVYGKLSVELSSTDASPYRITPVAQIRDEHTPVVPGFSCDSECLVFLSRHEGWLACVQGGKTRYAAAKEYSYDASLASSQGSLLFTAGDGVFCYDCASNDWRRIGRLPVTGLPEGSSGQAVSGSRAVVCETLGSVGVRDADGNGGERALTIYSLANGTRTARLMPSRNSRFLGLISVDGRTHASYRTEGGLLELADTTGAKSTSIRIPNELGFASGVTPLAIPCRVDGESGILAVEVSGASSDAPSRRGKLQLWMIGGAGKAKYWTLDVDYSPPSADVAELTGMPQPTR